MVQALPEACMPKCQIPSTFLLHVLGYRVQGLHDTCYVMDYARLRLCVWRLTACFRDEGCEAAKTKAEFTGAL